MNAKLLGVYKVKRNKEVLLLEFYIDCAPKDIDMGEFTQEAEGLPKIEWQVAYDEKYLNEDGDTVIGYFGDETPGETTRVCFYIYFLDINKPLLTPFGPVTLTEPTAMPKRLRKITKKDVFDD